MTNQPNRPLNSQQIVRIISYGFGLSVFGIIGFIVLWMGLSNLENAPRLFLSMCVPPLLIMLIMGGVVLYTRRK